MAPLAHQVPDYAAGYNDKETYRILYLYTERHIATTYSRLTSMPQIILTLVRRLTSDLHLALYIVPFTL